VGIEEGGEKEPEILLRGPSTTRILDAGSDCTYDVFRLGERANDTAVWWFAMKRAERVFAMHERDLRSLLLTEAGPLFLSNAYPLPRRGTAVLWPYGAYLSRDDYPRACLDDEWEEGIWRVGALTDCPDYLEPLGFRSDLSRTLPSVVWDALARLR
jgi:hypothetical protein